MIGGRGLSGDGKFERQFVFVNLVGALDLMHRIDHILTSAFVSNRYL